MRSDRNHTRMARVQKLLPDGVEVPSAYEAVGHIAHFNLREEHLPFKHLIGQVRCSHHSALCTLYVLGHTCVHTASQPAAMRGRC